MPALAAPPGIPGKPTGTVEGSRVALSWGEARDDEGVTGYNVYRDERYLTTVSGTRYVAELGSGESTSFYVTAFDSPSDGSPRGFSNRSPTATFAPTASPAPTPSPTPSPAPPVTPPDAAEPPTEATRPAAITGLRSRSASRDGVSLAWDEPAPGVIGYNVYRDGAYLTTVNGTSAYVDTRPPAAADSVSYRVVAFDAVPRFSPYSDALTVSLSGPLAATAAGRRSRPTAAAAGR